MKPITKTDISDYCERALANKQYQFGSILSQIEEVFDKPRRLHCLMQAAAANVKSTEQQDMDYEKSKRRSS